MVLDAIAFDSLLEGADLVITGEGRMTPKQQRERQQQEC